MDASVVMEKIRSHIGLRSLTHAQVASEISVSLPTLRRWLTGKGVTLDQLARLLKAVGLTLAELSSLVESGHPTFQYTVSQESLFVAQPEALALFDSLRLGLTVTEIHESVPLSAVSMRKLLKALEEVGLVERRKGNKVFVIPKGEPVWSKEGPLQKAFLSDGLKRFLSDCRAGGEGTTFQFGLHDLLPEDRIRVTLHLEELRRFLQVAEGRRKPGRASTSRMGMLFAFAPFPWSLLERIDEV